MKLPDKVWEYSAALSQNLLWLLVSLFQDMLGRDVYCVTFVARFFFASISYTPVRNGVSRKHVRLTQPSSSAFIWFCAFTILRSNEKLRLV